MDKDNEQKKVFSKESELCDIAVLDFLEETGCRMKKTAYEYDILILPDGQEREILLFEPGRNYLSDCCKAYEEWKGDEEE